MGLISLLAVLIALLQVNVSISEVHDFELITELDQLPLDYKGRLVDNWILFENTPECKSGFHNAWSRAGPEYRKLAAYSKKVSELFHKDFTSKCSAVSLTRGTIGNLLQYPLPNQIFVLDDEEINDDVILDWVKDQQEVEMGWTSYKRNTLTVYWIDPDTGAESVSGKISYGERGTLWINSHLGHQFKVRDDVLGTVEGTYVVEHDSYLVIGSTASKSFIKDVTRQVDSTFQDEWSRSRVVSRTFTELGFTLGKLPKDLWGSMSAYYYNNQESKIKEEWDDKGIFVNWWESDVYMVGMPMSLKRYWQARLQTLVEEWSGVELELTDIYGMRRYQDGARLLSHVDRQSTHAASLIINVAQGAMRKPWAVEIYDFADRLHEITMEEGDIVYYESARCLHGRMKPLEGAYYVNLFAHYRPKGDPNWYLKANPADGVPQLLDIGECEVRDNGTHCSKGEGRVPHLSPKLETLSGPDDLMRYWQLTAPTVDGKPAQRTEEL